MVRCNLTAEEGRAAFDKFSDGLSLDEENAILELAQPYLFYETYGMKNYRECHCTACHGTFDIYKNENSAFFAEHHNDTAACPNCGNEVMLKSIGRLNKWYGYSPSLRISDAVEIIEKGTDGALLIRAGVVVINYHREYLEPELEYFERHRYYLNLGKVQGWKRSCYVDERIANLYGRYGEWSATVTICKPFMNNWFWGYDDSYVLIGAENISESNLQYSQIYTWWNEETGTELFDTGRRACMIERYLAEYAVNQKIEILVKLGLARTVSERIEGNANGMDLNWRAKTPEGFFRLSKQDAKEFMYDPSLPLLHNFHVSEKRGAKTSMKQFRSVCRRYDTDGIDKLAECATRCGVSLIKADAYISGCVKAQSKSSVVPSSMARYWKDYLDMAQQLNYDLTREEVLMPKDLLVRHDAAAETVKALDMEKKNKLYAKRRKKLKEKYELEFDGLTIRVPVSGEEIIKEGKELQHCVGGYADRHMSGKTVILFLRHADAPNIPYVTIEMCGRDFNDIRQIHGFRNERAGAQSPKVKHNDFLSIWLQWLKDGSPRSAKGNPIINIQEEKTA